MSAIGNYIHLTKEGYLQHGTTKDGNFQGWKSQRQKILAKANNIKRHNSGDLQKIEEWTQSVMSSNKENNANIATIQAEIKNALDEAFNKQIASIDFEHGRVQNKETLSGKHLGTLKMSHGNFTVQLKTITNKINQLEEIGFKLLQDGELKDEEIAILEKQIQDMKKAYKDVYESTHRQITAWGYKQKKNATVHTENMTALKKAVNEMIDAYAKYPAVFLQEGTLFEDALAAAPHVADAAAYSTIAETLTKSNTGADYIMQDFNFENFDGRMHKQLSKTVQVDTDVATGRRKVDVEVRWQDDEEVKKMKISAKNIEIKNSTHKWITTVSGSPLLTMIQSLDADFINHYLNLYSKHYTRKISKGKELDDYKSTGIIGDNELIDELKLALFYISITGDNFGRKEDIAEVFAINDKTAGKVKLVPMANIISTIKDMTDKISIKLNGKSIGVYHFENKWEPDIQTRLNNLVMELHKAKVHASFNMMGVIKM
jgi:hypothetical protein